MRKVCEGMGKGNETVPRSLPVVLSECDGYTTEYVYPTGQTGQLGCVYPKGQTGPLGGMYPTGQTGQLGYVYPTGQTGQLGRVYPTGETGQPGHTYATGPTGQLSHAYPTGRRGQLDHELNVTQLADETSYFTAKDTFPHPAGAFATSLDSQSQAVAISNSEQMYFGANGCNSLFVRPETAMRRFKLGLTEIEHVEIYKYQEIYFLGMNAKKISGNDQTQMCEFLREHCGRDCRFGVLHDQIGFQYELLRVCHYFIIGFYCF